MTKPTTTDPWNVREEDFPWHGSPEEKLRFMLQYAVLAPSGHNTQPWLFRLHGEEVALYADRTRALPVIDPEDRELIMSCGAALMHLRLAMMHYGFTPVVRTFPDSDDPDLLAFVRIGPAYEASREEHRLFMAIPKRHTNRQPFEPRPIPPDELAWVREAAEQEGGRLHLFAREEEKLRLAELIAEGDRLQARDPRFRRELAAWIHPFRTRHRDGIPGYALSRWDPAALAGPLVVRTFVWGQGQAARDKQLAEGSPVLMVLSTEADNPAAWLTGGQALARALLKATDLGLSASFLNQPIEVASLRPRVRELIGGERCPQAILRMGYGRATGRPTPRRPVEDVLIREPYL